MLRRVGIRGRRVVLVRGGLGLCGWTGRMGLGWGWGVDLAVALCLGRYVVFIFD